MTQDHIPVITLVYFLFGVIYSVWRCRMELLRLEKHNHDYDPIFDILPEWGRILVFKSALLLFVVTVVVAWPIDMILLLRRKD